MATSMIVFLFDDGQYAADTNGVILTPELLRDLGKQLNDTELAFCLGYCGWATVFDAPPDMLLNISKLNTPLRQED